jgi:hypothetical protein
MQDRQAMQMGANVNAGPREAWLRWLPPVVLLISLLGLLFVPLAKDVFTGHSGELSLVILGVWALAALVIALVAHRRLIRNLARVTRAQVTFALTLLGALSLLSILGHISPAWIPLLLLLTHGVVATERPHLTAAASIFMILLMLALSEGLLVFIRSVPSLWTMPGFATFGRGFYWLEINLIQWDPNCSQWDPELSYTLRPGTCTFTNPGFSIAYKINRLGVRDDEESLDAPEVVVLGDSHAMGWGVEDYETFASHLEQMTGLKVLNTGISSYGTARELGLLQRVDRSRLRYVLIQYCNNDFEENQTYVNSGGNLPRRSPEWFQEQVRENKNQRRYYPGKYTMFWLNIAMERAGARIAPQRLSAELVSHKDEEETPGPMGYLLKVIEVQPLDLSAVEIIIFEMSDPAEHPHMDAALLKSMAAQNAGKRHMDRIHVVDVMTGLGPQYYLPFDGHMNALGHRSVAERLAPLMDRRPQTVAAP